MSNWAGTIVEHVSTGGVEGAGMANPDGSTFMIPQQERAMAQPAYNTITDTASGAWLVWREQVVSFIRADFAEVLQDVGEDDIDWDAWRPLFDQGHSPRSAVDQAFVRVTEA